MKICIGDEVLLLFPEDLEKMYINEGVEAKVYRHGDEALKIYRDYCFKPRLDENSVTRLSSIPTKRVLLPKRSIYRIREKKSFAGYSLFYVNSKPFDEMVNIDMEHFLNELDIIKDDMKILTNNGVVVEDLNISNILYDGRLYFCDPGSFSFDENPLNPLLNSSSNIMSLNEFISDSVFDYIATLIDRYYQGFAIDFDISEYIGDQVRDSVKSGETLKQYVRRIMR